jgi:peptidylprolyl isomerase
MTSAKTGDAVKAHYTGTLDDGTVFDSSKDRDPMEFVIGKGTLIPDFEDAVIGLKAGEAKNIHVKAENAYGEHRDDLIISIPQKELPDDLNPELGKMVQMIQSDGKAIVLRITGISSDEITVDANHELAGKDLNFDIQLVEIM